MKDSCEGQHEAMDLSHHLQLSGCLSHSHTVVQLEIVRILIKNGLIL